MKVRLRHHYHVINYDSYFIRVMNRENTGSMTTHIPTYYRPGYPNLVSPIFSTKSMSDHLTDHHRRSRVHSESKVLKSMHVILTTSKHAWRRRIWFVCQTLTVRVMGLWAFLVRLLRLVKVSFFNWAIWENSLHPTVNRFRVLWTEFVDRVLSILQSIRNNQATVDFKLFLFINRSLKNLEV